MSNIGYRIGDLPEATSAASGDDLELSLAGSAGSRKITVANLLLSFLALFGWYAIQTGENAAQVTSKFYPVGDVKRYGVTGVGDETALIQNAITNSQNAGICYITFRAGTFTWSSSLHVTQNDFEFRCAGHSNTSLQYTGSGSAIELGSDNGNPYTDGDYGGVSGFALKNAFLHYTGTTDTALVNGFGNYKAGTYGIRDWRGGSVRLEHSYISGFHYGFWGIQSDLNYWQNTIFGKNKVGFYLGPRCDQMVAIGCWSFQNDTLMQAEGCGGGRLIGWSTDTDGSSSTYPFVIKNYNDGAGHIRAAGKWDIDSPWLENFGTTASTQAVDAWFDIGRGDTQMNDAVTIREPHILTNFYSTVGVGRVLYLARVDQIRSFSVERPSGISGGFATNLRSLVKVQNGGASTTVPFVRCIDGDGESFRFVENYSATAVTAMMLGWSTLSYANNAIGGTGTVNLTVLSDASTFARLSLGSGSDNPDPAGSSAVLRGNTFGGHNVLDFQYSQTSTTTQGARIVAGCNATEATVGSGNAFPMYLFSNNEYKWKILPSAGISYMMSVQANTRLVPGTNGLQVRNVADTSDNLKVDDSGNATVRAGFGCNGKTPQAAATLSAAASDLATVIALANSMRTALVNNGVGA